MIKQYIISCLLAITHFAHAQNAGVTPAKPYISTHPKIFAPGIISLPDRHEFGSTFSNDQKEIYFGVDREGKAEILHSKLIRGVWSTPEVIITHEKYSFNDPMLSPDESRLYFISDMPLERSGKKKDYDIWYIERSKNGRWSAPIHGGDVINSSANEYYISFTNRGTMYFASNVQAGQKEQYNFDIYRSAWINGEFQKPEKIHANVNSIRYEADVFVAPDESYLIFCSIRKNGYGQGDLYISFKTGDNIWTEAINMGETINNEFHQLCPFVSQDGKLFFTSNQDIYWMDAGVIDHYRP
ncbi:hypothetical protein C900_00443 [Fulvivirga imtechensis AK7]|uniref:Uncharacterized protein n=1 Tax=Fulvivirga imtechensis AK7 TaxID=1237149 RepID=L8JHR9_9BACT|nr:PD40 domain-containing protein [Fulvivirga imtechensis]ELR68411.1 hypothetical protein C900_00443 [Fulvivirga imtechensis AK7]